MKKKTLLITLSVACSLLGLLFWFGIRTSLSPDQEEGQIRSTAISPVREATQSSSIAIRCQLPKEVKEQLPPPMENTSPWNCIGPFHRRESFKTNIFRYKFKSAFIWDRTNIDVLKYSAIPTYQSHLTKRGLAIFCWERHGNYPLPGARSTGFFVINKDKELVELEKYHSNVSGGLGPRKSYRKNCTDFDVENNKKYATGVYALPLRLKDSLLENGFYIGIFQSYPAGKNQIALVRVDPKDIRTWPDKRATSFMQTLRELEQ